MKTKILGLVFLFIFLSCSNNEPGVQTVEIREIGTGFDSVESSGAYDILITEGEPDGKIRIEGDSNLLSKIIIEINDHTLKISQKSGFYRSSGSSVKISFKARNLKSIVLTGSGSIDAEGVQETDNFKMVLDGSGDIEAEIETHNADLQLNGSGDIRISGYAERLRAGVAGSGDMHAFGLESEEANAGLTGSGNLEVLATQVLKAGVTGSGKLYYKGNPADTDFRTVGSGEVIRAE